MARKRLSDLLREEAQKPTEGESGDATTPEAPQKEATPSRGRSPRTQAKPSRAASAKASTSAQTKAASPPTSEPPASPTPDVVAPEPATASTPDEVAALTSQLSELQSAVTAAQRREDLLKHQVLDLETALDAEKERSQQLQEALDQTKLQTRPLVSLPDRAAPPPSSAKTLAQPTHHPVSIMEAELEKILQQPISSDAPYADLTNEDIGWMD